MDKINGIFTFRTQMLHSIVASPNEIVNTMTVVKQVSLNILAIFHWTKNPQIHAIGLANVAIFGLLQHRAMFWKCFEQCLHIKGN